MAVAGQFLFGCVIGAVGFNTGLLIKAIKWMRRHPEGADCRPELQALVHISAFTGGCFVALIVNMIVYWGSQELSGSPSAKWLAIPLLCALLSSAPALAMHPKLAGKANLVALLAAVALVSVFLFIFAAVWGLSQI